MVHRDALFLWDNARVTTESCDMLEGVIRTQIDALGNAITNKLLELNDQLSELKNLSAEHQASCEAKPASESALRNLEREVLDFRSASAQHQFSTNLRLKAVEKESVELRQNGQNLEQNFTKIRGDFDGMKARLDSIENKVNAMEGRLGKVEERLSKIDTKLSRVEKRLGKMEKKLDVALSELKEMRKVNGSNWLNITISEHIFGNKYSVPVSFTVPGVLGWLVAVFLACYIKSWS